MDAEVLQQIRANAALAIEELASAGMVGFGYNRDSVAYIDDFIERQRFELAGNDPGAVTSVLGCFLGEAIIASTGGAWAQSEAHGVGVRFEGNTWCFPLAKVAKQYAEGRQAGDSVLAFYDAALALARR